MKKIKILALLSAVAMLAGCSDKWLEEAKPQDGSLTPDIIFASEGGVTNALTGIYTLIRDYSPWSGNTNGGTHNVYGYRIQMYSFDAMGNDIIIHAPYGYFTSQGEWNAVPYNKTGTQSAVYWISFYKYINNANSLIEGVEASTALPAEFKASVIAEAKAIRAWSYFNLSRIYQNTYAMAKEKPCVPIYTKPATAAEVGQPRSTVSKVYELILADLAEENIQKIAKKQVQPYRLTSSAAYAIRAQVNLQMENWDAAQKDAATAIGANSANYPLMTEKEYNSGFNTLNGEVIWGLDIILTQGKNITSFAVFGAYDYSDFPYFCTYINSSFKALFSATDVRGKQIVENPNAEAANTVYLTKKFMSKFDAEMDDYLIRASEMVLIQAEAFARQGKTAEAQDMLFLLQSKRDPAAAKSSAAADALIEEILVERRKELYGEIGVQYFDLYRLDRPMVRDGNQIVTRQFTVPKASTTPENWMLQIPLQENQSNPNNGEGVNNPTRTTPK